MSHTFHWIPLRHVRHFRNTELGELYVSCSVKTFAESMVGIFLPLYLYNLGYDLKGILIYFIIWMMTKLVAEPFVAAAIARFGPKHIMSLSYLVRIIQLLLLASLTTLTFSAFWTAPLGGIVMSMFFTSYHINFARVRGIRDGQEIATMNILVAVASALGPLIGGLLAISLGLPFVLLLAAIIMLLSIRPLFKTAEAGKIRRVDVGRINWPAAKRLVPIQLPLSMEAMNINVVWPLFIALAAFGSGNFVALGVVVTISLLITIGVEVVAGKKIDHDKSRPLALVGVTGSTIGGLARIVARQGLFVAGADITSRASEASLKILYFHQLYQSTDRSHGHIEQVALIEWLGSVFKLTYLLGLLGLAFIMRDMIAIMATGFFMTVLAHFVYGVYVERQKS